MKNSSILLLMSLLATSSMLDAKQPLLLKDLAPSQLYSKQQVRNQIANISEQQKTNLTQLQQEYITLKRINQLNANAMSEDDLALLKRYTNYKSQTFIRHDEGPLPVAIFDLASAAKHKIHQHYVYQQTQEYKKSLDADWQSFLRLMMDKSDLQQKVAQQSKIEMIKSLSATQASKLVINLLVERNYDDSLVLQAISKTKDFGLISGLLQKNASASAHKILINKVAEFSANQQEQLLRAVIEENTILASNAFSLYAKLPANTRDDGWLSQQLSDPLLGASAAKAIGTSQSQIALENASQLVENKSSNRVQVANGLLALRFANNDFAKNQLNRLLEKNLIQFEDMQLEVEKWLD